MSQTMMLHILGCVCIRDGMIYLAPLTQAELSLTV
jgi:hypothetical protein